MFKSKFDKIKRKIYLDYLKENNPKQYELEYKYSPERTNSIPTTRKKERIKQWFKDNIFNIINSIITILSLIVAILALLKQ